MEHLFLRKSKKRGLTEKPLFEFDLQGNLIYKHASVTVAAENLFISCDAIKSAVSRKSVCKGRWYFSYESNFEVPLKITNPLFPNNAAKLFTDLEDVFEDEQDYDW